MTATDADDAGLVEANGHAVHDAAQGTRKNWAIGEPKAALLERLRAQRREIEELMREALSVMDDVRDICTFDVKMGGSIYTGTNASACMRAYKAASAFAAKHGGRDG